MLTCPNGQKLARGICEGVDLATEAGKFLFLNHAIYFKS